ncbi:MAG: hypothetical protein Q3976_07460 [Corynebacterium sp.]|nr:hypothetical protein [Corynebacterium sp.]
MDATEINGGRFYARPLHNDDRIDDAPALSNTTSDFDITTATAGWQADQAYTWAVCEQTRVEMIAFAHLDVASGVLEIYPVGDPACVLPNDPDVETKTIGDAVAEIREPILRWCHASGVNVTTSGT